MKEETLKIIIKSCKGVWPNSDVDMVYFNEKPSWWFVANKHYNDDGEFEYSCTKEEFEKVAREMYSTGYVDAKCEDAVNNPKHYTGHPSGIECIQITEHMGFNLGNALKYIWRCDLKQDAIEDLNKAKWYIEREIAKRELRK